MKIQLRNQLAVIAASTTLFAASSAFAGDYSTNPVEITNLPPVETGFYFEGFGGVLFLDDLHGSGSARVDAEFDTGYIAGGAFGYQFTPALSLEIEGAYGEADLEGLAINGRNLSAFDGELGLTQVSANLIYEFGPQNAITPYVGFGIGAGFLEADFNYAGNFIDDDDTALYYQFIGGVSVDLSERMSLYAEYRYGVLEEFELRRGSGSVNFDDLNAHQAIVGLQIKF